MMTTLPKATVSSAKRGICETTAAWVSANPRPAAVASSTRRVCEPGGIEDAEEITHYGGWRAYMAERQ